MKKYLFLLILSSSISFANVIGTEYQNFNPSISGTDFTTVHSSEPVKECMCNLGIFFNYAKNTLTYSDRYYQTNTDLLGVRANDFLLGADLFATFGLSKNWDIGIALPFLVTGKNDDPYGVSYFEQFGLTEIRPMTKYRFLGDDSHGLAVVASANFNSIQNNPFVGDGAGPTFNLELAADATVWGELKLAGNVGIRKRSPGKQLTDRSTGLLVPFVPFSDSMIYSFAVARKFESLNSDLLAELKGSQPGGSGTDSVKTAQQAMELGIGLRHQWSKETVVHVGGGSKLNDAQSTPDVRAYIGMNYQMGPVFCDVPVKPVAPVTPAPKAMEIEVPVAIVKDHPVGESEKTDLKMPVTAVNPADFAAYRWKIGATPDTDCMNEAGYGKETPGTMPIVAAIGPIPDGGITLCAVAKNKAGIWQPFTEPTIINWTKKRGYELFRLNVSVLFDFDEDTLQKRSYSELEKINNHLKSKPFTALIVEGHTDNIGTDAYNMDLSKRRANRVMTHLIKTHGVDKKKVKTDYKGEKYPVDTNDTKEGRDNNRRVEFKIYRK